MGNITLVRLAVAALSLAASSAVTAANYVKIVGEHADFYYDAEVFGAGNATVVGDTISLDLQGNPNFGATIVEKYTNSSRESYFVGQATDSLIAVAHSGYQLFSRIDSSGSVMASTTGGSFYGDLTLTNEIYTGVFNNNVAVNGAFIFNNNPATISTPFIRGQGSYELAIEEKTTGTGEFYSTLMFNQSVVNSLHQSSPGTGYLGVSSLSYAFYAVADGGTPPPVPEPETYAMLLAGLGLLGWVSRRKQS